MKLSMTRPRKVAVGVGATLGLASLAFAATSIVSGIGGATSVVGGSEPGAQEGFQIVSVSGSTHSGYSNQEKCEGAASGNDVTLKATLTRSNGSVYGQGCTFTIRVSNPRGTAITGAAISVPATQDALKNWNVSSRGPATVAAGTLEYYYVTLSPRTNNPAEGSFTGTLTGTAGD
ncbi:hypothetical protein [Actinomycetospora soli]|uniref:hypothetical protein n=1 Tax=Actinomycetospora soli TaxID=2893887 RepID=UPI001E6159B7|nr:hypothetical protein [Actinomycetospora soli]MCD2186626.1 hypothetical protein [Actinomycetospora soli]